MGSGGQRPAQKHPGGGKELGSPWCPHQPCCLPELLPGCLPPHKPAGVTTSHPRLGALPLPLTAGLPAASPRPPPQSEQKPTRLRRSREQPAEPEPVPCTAHRARPAPRGSQSARPRAGAPPSPGSTSARRPGPRPPPVPTLCRLAGCWAPRGSERPPHLGQAALCAWSVLPSLTSLPKERTRAKRGGPASREAPAAPRAPHVALPAFRRVGRPPYPALWLR